MIRMLMALTSLGRFTTINQYFPIRGHSFLPCDRDFAVIKRFLKKFDHTYILEEYIERIKKSAAKQSFEVRVPKTEDIINYKKWWPKFYKKDCVAAESQGRGIQRDQKVNFKVSQFMHFSYSSTTPNKVSARNYIDGLQSYTFLLQTSKEVSVPLPSEKAYSDPLPINTEKMANLKIFQKYLTDERSVQSFWDEIYMWPTKDKNNEDNDE